MLPYVCLKSVQQAAVFLWSKKTSIIAFILKNNRKSMIWWIDNIFSEAELRWMRGLRHYHYLEAELFSKVAVVAIHPTEKFTPMNLFKILCVVTWA